MMSGTMPCDSSILITPTCAKPRAAPPPSASAIFGGNGTITTGGGGSGVGGGVGVAAQPASSIEVSRTSEQRSRVISMAAGGIAKWPQFTPELAER